MTVGQKVVINFETTTGFRSRGWHYNVSNFHSVGMYFNGTEVRRTGQHLICVYRCLIWLSFKFYCKILTHFILGNFSCFFVVCRFLFFKINFFWTNDFRNTTRMSNSLEPDQARRRLSADDTCRSAKIMTVLRHNVWVQIVRLVHLSLLYCLSTLFIIKV